MSSSQSKELVTAINASMAIGAQNTVQALNSVFSAELEGLTTTINESSNRELEELKKINKEQSNEHRKEMQELRRQTFLLAEALGDRKDTVIQMDGFAVGKALTSRY